MSYHLILYCITLNYITSYSIAWHLNTICRPPSLPAGCQELTHLGRLWYVQEIVGCKKRMASALHSVWKATRPSRNDVCSLVELQVLHSFQHPYQTKQLSHHVFSIWIRGSTSLHWFFVSRSVWVLGTQWFHGTKTVNLSAWQISLTSAHLHFVERSPRLSEAQGIAHQPQVLEYFRSNLSFHKAAKSSGCHRSQDHACYEIESAKARQDTRTQVLTCWVYGALRIAGTCYRRDTSTPQKTNDKVSKMPEVREQLTSIVEV